jgi:hypothetical protein
MYQNAYKAQNTAIHRLSTMASVGSHTDTNQPNERLIMPIKLNMPNKLGIFAISSILLFATISSEAAPAACEDPGAHMLADLSAVKPQVALSESQSALWQKAEDAMRRVGQNMQKRRAQHIAAKDMMDAEDNPRAFAARMDQEMTTDIEQMKQVREQWFIVHDALDAQQRDKVHMYMQARMKEARDKFQAEMAANLKDKNCGPGHPPMGMMPPPFPF